MFRVLLSKSLLRTLYSIYGIIFKLLKSLKLKSKYNNWDKIRSDSSSLAGQMKQSYSFYRLIALYNRSRTGSCIFCGNSFIEKIVIFTNSRFEYPNNNFKMGILPVISLANSNTSHYVIIIIINRLIIITIYIYTYI